jgi:hypothetical protein
MGKENAPDKGAENQEEGKNLLSNDKVRKLINEEIPYDSLNTDERAEFHNRFIEGDEEGVPTVEEEAATAADNPPENNQTPTPPEENPQTPNLPEANVQPVIEEDADTQALKQKLKAEKDAKNTLQQRLDSANQKLANLDAMKVPEPPQVNDPLDDNVNQQNKWNKDMAKKLNNYAESEKATIEKDKVATETSLLYSDVSILQTENPELRTSLPIETLDKTYSRFRDGLAGAGSTAEQKNEAISKYFGDHEFRRTKEGEGHVFPISEADWKGYTTLNQVIGFKRNGGDASHNFRTQGDKYSEMDVAYYKYNKVHGYLPDPVKKAALESATQVADQIADNQSKPNLLSPDVGQGSDGLEGMTEQQAEQWLLDHPAPSTPEEVAILRGILNKYSPNHSQAASQEIVF